MGVEKVYIGKMDRYIEINIRTKTKTDVGSESYIYTNIASVWAKRESLTSTEDYEDKIVAVNVYKYSIRYHPDIAAETIQNLYVVDQGVEFDIHGVNPVDRNRYLILTCSRRE